MNNRTAIWLIIMLVLTVFATWNFSKPLNGISIWDEQPTIAQAYGSGFLMSIPMWVGFISIILMIREVKPKTTSCNQTVGSNDKVVKQ